ncbi:1A family penicillin-binding protein [Scopulibacillus darangshiensis]|uniref:1A family penicillin-binding protein n=1 Tax=Scopulibacillus darangshiensis TaxID=442528 RepID=A0A4R2NMV2_9BACL|nr:PBP1A family penicillin-binding protein [Scopulibacillus darangshiensis]TCP23023.1 1A family penicillin-binding protein [Scopulibacillus darangshiensis]
MDPATRYQKKGKVVRLLLKLSLLFLLLMAFFILSLWVFAKIQGPPPVKVPQTTRFYDADGHQIGKMEHQNQNRYWVKLDDIADPLKQATVAVEDKRFYKHHGFDLRRLAGAVVADIKSMSKEQGASTITMQYARNLFLTNDKTWTRKLAEAFYTMRLEMNYSKDEILEGYLNTIYYGRGAYGIEAASKYYFNKDADDLSLAEASMLAGVPKGPSYYSPYNDFDKAKHRQRIVLNSMVSSGYITKQQADNAFEQPIHLVKKHKTPKRVAPYFQDTVEYVLKHKLHIDEKTLATGGLKVYTTLHSDMQKKAEYWVKQVIDPKSDIQTAMVAMNPKSGAVEAMIGGRNYKKSSYNRAVQAKRSPGSSFKPFLYYAALRNGFTPSTALKSEPTTFRFDDGKEKYSPSNFGGYYAYGPITLAQALALSDNIYAVKTHLSIGMDKLVKTAKKVGITSPLGKIPSLALGTKPVSVAEMARGYSAIANGGARVTPHYISKIVNQKGEVIYEWEPKKKQVLDKPTTFVLSQLMTGVFDSKLNDYSKVTGSTVSKMLTHKMAAKTGSTAADSWMVGFTPKLVSAVWIGYDKGKSLSTYPETGYSKLIWTHFMEAALEGAPKNGFKPPKGVVGVLVDPDTGKLATKACPNARMTYYLKGTEPQEYCDKHKGEHSHKKDQHKDNSKDKGGFFNRLLNLFD